MAYHFTGKMVQRSAQRSVVAAAAYRAAARLYDERLGRTVSPRRLAKPGVIYSEILLPAGAPPRWLDRAALWNEVERIERRHDAALARDIELTLPRELSQAEAIRLARDFAVRQFVARGMVADLNISEAAAGTPQPLAHIMLSLRRVEPGPAECPEQGGFGAKERGWNEKALLMSWRAAWADLVNARLAETELDQQLDTRIEPQQPKWLQPVGPLAAASLPIVIDPRLGADDDTASRLEQGAAEPLLNVVTVFMTSNYDTVLAAEISDDAKHGPHVLVRAATGDEAAYPLSSDDEEGELTANAGGDITWQETKDSAEMTEPAVVLWSGEVLLKTGKGVAGPFYTHKSAATAWAFSTAVGMPPDEVFGAQLVRWLCARSKADLLAAGGDDEFRQLNRCWIAPIRIVVVLPISLPGQKQEGDEFS
jgi:hypothetical protein